MRTQGRLETVKCESSNIFLSSLRFCATMTSHGNTSNHAITAACHTFRGVSLNRKGTASLKQLKCQDWLCDIEFMFLVWPRLLTFTFFGSNDGKKKDQNCAK